ncbi:hypothetical protein BJ138DRAFT_1162910 [Hygrophoropsis aurantiaca]|uniref:Uncharacterized protein n=1 Tax=Hygrophoropsis aurantiaca TaxID=72124 RepID=A0ACB8A082_9AGAM|nr:hypothetical protein BJ138DRAFT_1162910 [Hygrophoropsis aurantiaca]
MIGLYILCLSVWLSIVLRSISVYPGRTLSKILRMINPLDGDRSANLLQGFDLTETIRLHLGKPPTFKAQRS